MKKLLLGLIFLIYACGYEPIYLNKNNDLTTFSRITLDGDKEINRKILNSLNIKQDTLIDSGNELIVKSSFKIEETAKNTKGKVVSYRSSASVQFEITKNKKVLKDKIFYQDFTYGNRDNKFDLVEYQKTIKNNIINKITEEIILYINLK
jgi:hypothetical protein